MKYTGERFIPAQYSGQMELEHLNRYYFVINQINLKDKIIIDLASGEGYGSNLLSKFAHTVYGVDLSQEAIDHSKQNYKKENLIFLTGDASNIPLPDQTADIFVSFETIEHHDLHNEMLIEIKRVLKPNGILIISSPDKYYYSDLPDKKNEFHVKELYYNEFKALINNHFKQSVYFSQRIFIGSLIVSDDDNVHYHKPLIINKSGDATILTPVYNIAVATDQSNLCFNYPIIGYTEDHQTISNEELKYEIWKGRQQIANSRTYRVGRLIVYPIKKLIGIFK